MSTNLDLWRQLPAGSAADLDIGAVDGEQSIRGVIAAHQAPAAVAIHCGVVVPARIATSSARDHAVVQGTLVIDATLSGHCSYRPAIHAAQVFNASIAINQSDLRLRGNMAYDINVYRSPSGYGGSMWRPMAADLARQADLLAESSSRHIEEVASQWDESAAVSTGRSAVLQALPRLRTGNTMRYGEAAPVDVGSTSTAGNLPRNRSDAWLSHCNGDPRDNTSVTPFLRLLPRRQRVSGQLWRSAGRLLDNTLAAQRLTHGWLVIIDQTARYEEAIWPPAGRHEWPDIITPPVDIKPTNLDLRRPRQPNADLEFWYPDGNAIIIPTRGVYVVVNSVVFYIASDGREIPVSDLTVDGDCDSWAWQFSATLPRIADASAVDGEEVVIVINGHESRHIVDGWSDNLAWGQQSATLTGRSLSAELSSSLALSRSYTETNQRTMSQLATQELPTGWTLDWQAADWLVPAGAWSYSNLAPIDAIAQLAEAAGAFILPDMSRRHLTIVSRYPVKPWGMTDNDVQLVIPSAITVTRGRQLTRGQNADAVWLSSPAGRLQALIRKSGTAGSNLLADVSNPLITDATGAQALGIALLAASMDKSTDTLELPISEDTGLILPGRIIQTGDGIGYSRSLRQTARINDDRKLVVRQSIELERQRQEVTA